MLKTNAKVLHKNLRLSNPSIRAKLNTGQVNYMIKKYYIKTYGCQMNYSDSERIAGMLKNMKIKEALDIKEANLVIINTCGVRQMAEDRVYGLIHNIRRQGTRDKRQVKIIMTGCLANRKDVIRRMKSKVDLFCEIKEVETLKNFVIKELKHSLKIQSASRRTKFKISEYLSIAPNYENKFSAYVPVMTGCNNFCSYCVVPYARGREISRKASEIVAEIKTLLKKGYQEITLLGQNVNSYCDNTVIASEAKQSQRLPRRHAPRKDINFADLLKIINKIPGNFWIRFLTSHPKDMSDELIETIAKSKKVCEYVHLPIQAGDDKILEKMNRKYSAKHYLNLVAKIKKAFAKYKPKEIYSLNGDIIVGFPGETKKQFLQSAEIMKKVGYDMIFFGQFSPRPGTVAFKMKNNVSKAEKVRREKFLNEILKKTAYQNNQSYLNKTIEVLIDSYKPSPISKGRAGEGSYFGRTRTMKNVKISIPTQNLPFPRGGIKGGILGKIIKAKITKANIWNLEAEIK